MSTIVGILMLVIGLVIGGGAGFYVRTVQKKTEEVKAEEEKKRIIRDSESKAKEMLFEARSEAFKVQEEAKKDEREKRVKLQAVEERLVKKEETLDQKMESAERLKEELESKVTSVKELKAEVQAIYEQQKGQLEKVAGLTKDDARNLLLKKVEEESKGELVAYVKKLESAVKAEAEDKARNIIADAIQKYAAETAVESTATIVALPTDEMKGRIIGREGRNINTFEQVTGVDVIVDDTPGSIVISGFDLVRRYIAKVALERLVEDGRIHPARIEEMVKRVKEEVNVLIKELGERAAVETGVIGLPLNLIKILGRLKFRVSYGQNVLKHSMEVSFLAAHMATELGADANICRKAGLLHDIGKAVDHEIQGKHAVIGRDILKKFGIAEDVIHCVEAHEGDIDAESVEAKIVQAANLISISRPGANKENLDNFVKRLDEVENMVNSFIGVKKSYAIQAGREVRVFVDPDKVDDLQAIKLSHEIAKKIENDLKYPGQIKVDVIRERREEAYAE
ncbi:ribonuclease Y [Candidatus Peregrinibacteria bacterium RIFOXYB12_FULL_41_12]|nr:MAG: ribonuclease Y [Candidatus Peregrinibacteria bacterium RIFOXYB12_FULL_41_12]OGJ48694.1 MAG: ribonuclease Y [Candidatus Peregrinibacteria bacterium RIFOXYA2_FULL_41_18]OGJ52971.1 MAG: ribonuclease Y [Candidatus Peregrinibacteria bacterium RIFOXYC2_FULL_41_22]OGJ53278.1 MAG: ribonuclease Y [Candidatus Peregrinibacteria bacterium RIFOXYB2_FULL_41_88]